MAVYLFNGRTEFIARGFILLHYDAEEIPKHGPYMTGAPTSIEWECSLNLEGGQVKDAILISRSCGANLTGNEAIQSHIAKALGIEPEKVRVA